jgi:hypothetical protein
MFAVIKNVKRQATDDFDLTAGRLLCPTYLFTLLYSLG